MNDSSNLSLLDHQVDQSDAAIQIATSNGLPLPKTEENLTNVFSGNDDSIANPLYEVVAVPSPAPVIVRKRVGLKDILFKVGTKIRGFIDRHKSRELALISSRVNMPAVIPNTGKDISLLPDKRQVEQSPKRLANPMADNYGKADFWSIIFWNESHDNVPSANNEQWRQVAKVLSEAWHVPDTDPSVIMTYDFNTMVAVIRKLRKKVGESELVIMLLLALIVKKNLYTQIGCKSETAFFRSTSEIMGISSSRARDYCKRGTVFLDYHKDFFGGADKTTEIPFKEFVASHMSKLTIYEKAVKKFGNEGALARLKSLTFREFQAQLVDKDESTVSDKMIEHPYVDPNEQPKNLRSVHLEQKEEILELNLTPSEKRLLRIIAKGGKYCSTKYLTEEQVILVETRLRQKRPQVIENNLRLKPKGFVRKGYSADNPLAFSGDLYELKNANDIILRIREGIAQAMPDRYTIAILVYRLCSERKSEWQNPYGGPKYKKFRDFAMDKLGMGEDYRDYVAVGKVLKKYYYFLNGLSDMDTENLFFKLRYLPKALTTHKEDEHLVLARLRSLTVREFKLFSEEPDFEITFSKKLSKKKLEQFHYILNSTRAQERWYLSDFIEIYDEGERSWVERIVDDVLNEAGVLFDPPKTRVSSPETAVAVKELALQQV